VHPLRALARGLRAITDRSAADREIDDELAHYLEQAVADHRARGLSASEARRAARLEIGNVTIAREQVRTSGWEHTVDTAVADLRYAARRLRATPAYRPQVSTGLRRTVRHVRTRNGDRRSPFLGLIRVRCDGRPQCKPPGGGIVGTVGTLVPPWP
jgi:hypothetical protein